MTIAHFFWTTRRSFACSHHKMHRIWGSGRERGSIWWSHHLRMTQTVTAEYFPEFETLEDIYTERCWTLLGSIHRQINTAAKRKDIDKALSAWEKRKRVRLAPTILLPQQSIRGLSWYSEGAYCLWESNHDPVSSGKCEKIIEHWWMRVRQHDRRS